MYPLLTLYCKCWLALRQVLVLARLMKARHQSLHEITTQTVLNVSPKSSTQCSLGAHTSMWNLAKVGELCHCVAECNLSCHPGRQAQAQRPACFACDRCQVPIWLASHLVHQDVKLESDTKSFESLALCTWSEEYKACCEALDSIGPPVIKCLFSLVGRAPA